MSFLSDSQLRHCVSFLSARFNALPPLCHSNSSLRFRRYLFDSDRALPLRTVEIRFVSLPLLCRTSPVTAIAPQSPSVAQLLSSAPFKAFPTPFVSYPSRHIRHIAVHVFAFAARRRAIRASRRDSTAVRFEVTRYSAFPPPCLSWECCPLLTAALSIISTLFFAVALRSDSIVFIPMPLPFTAILRILRYAMPLLISTARLPAPRLRRFPTHLSYEPRHAFAPPITSERFVSVPLP